MVTMAPPALLNGAVRQPLAYGLFSAFTLRPATGDRWEAGAQWELGTCDPVDGLGQAQCDPEDIEGLPKNLDPNLGEDGLASSFTVYGHFQCSPVGWTPERAQAAATEHLIAREEARVEQAFWTGDLGNVPSLEAAGVDTLTGTVNVLWAIGLLEQYIAANYGSTGVIHMTRAAAVVGLAEGALITSGGRLTTSLGTPVVAGAGYPGSGPAGEVAAAGTTWMFASPALFGYRSEVFTSSDRPGDLFDRAQNDLYAVAERSYLLGFDPCGVAAILVDFD